MYLFAQTPQVDAITGNQFFILSIALALSTYISTVSREVERSIRNDIRARDVLNALGRNWDKLLFLVGLIISDTLLWFILLPIAAHIRQYFIDQVSSYNPVRVDWISKLLPMPNWIGNFIFFVTLFALILHIVQWCFQSLLIVYTVGQSKWLYRLLIKSKNKHLEPVVNSQSFRDRYRWSFETRILTPEDLEVYLALAKTSFERQTIRIQNDSREYRYVVKTVQMITQQTTLQDVNIIGYSIGKLVDLGFIIRIDRSNQRNRDLGDWYIFDFE
jgi:hypothetical protein